VFTKGVVALTRRFTEEEKTNDILAQLARLYGNHLGYIYKKNTYGAQVWEREKSINIIMHVAMY